MHNDNDTIADDSPYISEDPRLRRGSEYVIDNNMSQSLKKICGRLLNFLLSQSSTPLQWQRRIKFCAPRTELLTSTRLKVVGRRPKQMVNEVIDTYNVFIRFCASTIHHL